MSHKLMMTRSEDENGKQTVTFSNYSPSKPANATDEYITKEQALDFISYLRNKTIIIDSQIIHYRTFFNYYTVDLKDEAAEIARIIKSSNSPYEAYRKLAHRKAKNNCLWKTVPDFGYIFLEDFYEYLESAFKHGYAEVLADIRSQKYDKSKYTTEFPNELIKWVNVGVMPSSRSVLLKYFPTEWMNYCYQRYEYTDNPFLVEKVSNKGAYNYSRYEKNKIKMNTEPERICISYDSVKNPIPETDVINAAKMLISALNLDRVNIHDFSTEYTVVVRNQNKINRETNGQKTDI